MESARGLAWRDALAEPQRLLLGGCLLLSVLLIGWEIRLSVGGALYAPGVAATAVVTSAQDRNYAERIASADLFGHGTLSGPSSGGNQPLPETNLQLTLRGVFTASDPSHASAIIETGDGHAQVVRVGIAVAPDTVLHQVYGNRVVLARNGALENLYFPAADTDSGLPPSVGSPTSGDSAKAPENADNDAGSGGGDLSADQKRANILKRLEELRQRSSHQ